MSADFQQDVTLQAGHRARAAHLRRVSNSTSLERTLRKVVLVLAEAEIPSLVIGGYAVQEHGYARFTPDLDLVVPDVPIAQAVLFENSFCANAGSLKSVTDEATRVVVDLFRGCESFGGKSLPLPKALIVSPAPTIITLSSLLEMRLSRHLGFPASRAQDFADVVELTRANQLPLALELNPAVSEIYRKMWQGLRQEAER